MDDAFSHEFIREYGRAFDRYDLTAIMNSYYFPCFIVKAGKIHTLVTEEAKRSYFEDLLDGYRDAAYARAETPTIEVKHLGPDSALVTVNWHCLDDDDEVVFDFWDTYHLVRVGSEWRILGDTVYDA